MVGAWICLGLCYLGLLACGIILLVDTIQVHKWNKEHNKRWKK